jgi:hypothetical protein
MQPLPPEMLPAVPRVAFGIFNLAIPNIVAWGVVIGVVLLAVWVRLPRFFEPEDQASKEEGNEPDATSVQVLQGQSDL